MNLLAFLILLMLRRKMARKPKRAQHYRALNCVLLLIAVNNPGTHLDAISHMRRPNRKKPKRKASLIQWI